MKIILLGYMGVGKTSISKLLSKKMGLPYFDLDEIIEQYENASVREIFETKGEIYFRKIEHRLLSEFLAKSENFILGLGGGTPCYSDNHLFLLDKNIESIFLKSSVANLIKNLSKEKNNRPLIKDMSDDELEEFIAKHLFERTFYYQKAKHTIIVDEKSKSEIVKMIMSLF